ncbi:MAG: VanZ family protein [Candidatus Omnitrophica bacterium]|nr:VanZ family protein [Candidatus Omnitrophota bacterium]MCM8832024.1 VanZ family protein [Candidatus Omnitrophota bacterium]
MRYIFSWYIIFAYTFFIFYFSLTPKVFVFLPHIPNIDKIVHFFIYLVLSFLVLNTLKLRKNSFPYIFAFTYGFLVGIVIEIFQYFLPYRSFEIKDLIVNIFGTIFGLKLKIYD